MSCTYYDTLHGESDCEESMDLKAEEQERRSKNELRYECLQIPSRETAAHACSLLQLHAPARTAKCS